MAASCALHGVLTRVRVARCCTVQTKADDLPMEVAEDECIADAENEMEINACKEG